MKYISKITVSMAIVAGLTVNCHKGDGGDGGAKLMLMAQQIASAASGGCAINVNLGGLYIGSIYSYAINSQFSQSEYEAASGSTVTAQGFSAYTSVPYNRKYDAFVKTGGTYTTTNRNSDIASGKATADAAAYLGQAAAVCSAAPTTTGAVLAATLSGFRTASASVSGSLSSTEATAMEAILTAGGTSSTAIEAAFTAGGCAAIATTLGTLYTNFGGSTTTASVYLGRLNYATGSAMMACTRIPRSQCSLSAISTATRSAGIASVVRAHEMFLNYADCRKPAANFAESVLRYQTTGLPSTETIPAITSALDTRVGFKIRGAYTNSIVNEGSTSSFSGNQIYAENAYPVSSALASTAPSFTALFPLTSGSAAFDTTTYRGGGNISLTTIDSCEAIGLGSVGPVPVKSSDTYVTLDNKKNLTEAKEIAYAFSDNAAVATAYLATYTLATTGAASTAYITGPITGATSSISADTIACNKAMRNAYTVSGALGGGKLPVIDVAFGDGGRTSLFTACLYGGSSATRTTIGTMLGSSVTSLSGITDCPSTASTAATAFPKNGTAASFTTFPNN